MSTLTEIIKDMEGHRSTSGWDIVCCYNQEKINLIFEKKYWQNKIISKLDLSGEFELPFVGTVKFESQLKLNAPKIVFSVEVGKQCKLIMNISDGYALIRDKSGKEQKENIPANTLRVVCIAPIAAASGDWKEINDGKTPIVFKKGAGSTQHIFLHFKNTEMTTFKLEPIEGKESEAKKLMICQPGLSDDFKRLLTQYFKTEVSEISYELAALGSTTSSGILPMTPKSFIFAQSLAIGNSPASLNLYIQAEESGNPPGDISPSFQPSGRTIAPIAEGYTASLVISGTFMEKLLLKGFSAYSPKVSSHTSNCLKIALKVNHTVEYPEYYRDVNHYFKGIKIDMNKSSMYFSINTSGTDTKARLEFDSESVKGYFTNYDCCSGQAVGGSGYIHASFKIDQSQTLTFGNNGLIPISATVESSGVDITTRIEMTRGGWEISQKPIIDGIKRSVPKAVSSIKVNMDSISTFVTTNLLFPEHNYFVFNSGEKYYMPYDFIAFGNLNFNSNMYQSNMIFAALNGDTARNVMMFDNKIKPGDIMVFEAGDDYIGKSIAWLTDSTVSHAAMVYSEDEIIEMGSNGIMSNRFQYDNNGEKVYLLRLNSSPDAEPLINAAKAYLNAKVQYDFPALFILAGLLIYRRVRPTPRWQKITDTILSLACLQLDKLLNQAAHKKNVMVCSQLVYQCYLDCGEDYAIFMSEDLLAGCMDEQSTICLADFSPYAPDTLVMESIPQDYDVDALAEELFRSLEESDTASQNELLQAAVSWDMIPAKAAKFLDMLEKLLKEMHLDIPVDALFVTPADLLNRAKNLVQYDVIHISRK